MTTGFSPRESLKLTHSGLTLMRVMCEDIWRTPSTHCGPCSGPKYRSAQASYSGVTPSTVSTWAVPRMSSMVGKLVAIDGQGDLRVIGQHVHLRGVRRGPKHDRLAIPMEPDRYHAWCPITPRVGQSCEVGGVQQLLCNRIIEERQIPPFSRHFSLLSQIHRLAGGLL